LIEKVEFGDDSSRATQLRSLTDLQGEKNKNEENQ